MQSAKPPMRDPPRREAVYSRTTSMAVKNTVRLKGIMAIAVSIGVRPCTIWIYSGTVKFSIASSPTTVNMA